MTSNDMAVTEEKKQQPTTFFQRYGLLLSVALICVLIDQVTKRIVEANIELWSTVPFIDPYLNWTRTQNFGASFGLFQNGGLFFVFVAIIVAGVILYYAPRLPVNDKLSRVALGLQLGGAVGNVIDRLRQGYVTDFIHFRIPQIGFDWPVSNFADIFIVSGVILLIAASFLSDGKKD
jgi:signal peptidase II